MDPARFEAQGRIGERDLSGKGLRQPFDLEDRFEAAPVRGGAACHESGGHRPHSAEKASW